MKIQALTLQVLLLSSSLMLISCSGREATESSTPELSDSAPTTPVVDTPVEDTPEVTIEEKSLGASMSLSMNRSARGALYHKRDWTMQERIDFALKASLINLRAAEISQNEIILKPEAGEYANFSAYHMETSYRLINYVSESAKFSEKGSYRQEKKCAATDIEIGSDELVNDEYIPVDKKIYIDGNAQNTRRSFEISLKKHKADLTMTLVHTDCNDESISGSEDLEFEREAATYALEIKCSASWKSGDEVINFSKCDVTSKHAKVNYDYNRVFNFDVKMNMNEELEASLN